MGRDVTVALSTKSLRKCFHIQKDASWAGNSPGIILKTNGPLLFVLIDNWCYKIIFVPGPRTKLFDVKNLVRPYVELQVLDELFSCPIIYQYPETLSHSVAQKHEETTRDSKRERETEEAKAREYIYIYTYTYTQIDTSINAYMHVHTYIIMYLYILQSDQTTITSYLRINSMSLSAAVPLSSAGYIQPAFSISSPVCALHSLLHQR